MKTLIELYRHIQYPHFDRLDIAMILASFMRKPDRRYKVENCPHCSNWIITKVRA